MSELQPLSTLVLTIAGGIFSLILAEKSRIPSILYLLLFGILLGPEGVNLIQPKVFQPANFPHYISIMVALILFEGGASLKFSQFREVSGTVKNLLSVGLITTLTGVAAAAHFAAGLSWAKAVLLGSIMVVTGPTVVIPILHRIRVKENLHNILKWEAILIDPLGVVISVVLFEFLLSEHVGIWASLGMLGGRFALGIALGLAAGFLIILGLTKQWLLRLEGEELGGLFVLAVVLLFYGISEWLMPHSGLVAATTAGLIAGNRKFAFKDQIFHFESQVTLFALSALFILLSSNIPARATQRIMGEGLVLLFILVLVIRPLAVFLSTLKDKKLSFREKLFLSLLAPRGIVSASLASIFALSFEQKALTSRGVFLPLAFFLIAGTIVFYAATSPLVVRWLGVKEEEGNGVLIVGANPLGFFFADLLKQKGIPVTFLDTNPIFCSKAAQKGFPAHFGSGFDKEFLESLDLKGVGTMISLTPNHEVNVLSCQTLAEFLGRRKVYRLWDKTDSWETAAANTYDESWGKPLLATSALSSEELVEKLYIEKRPPASRTAQEQIKLTPENINRPDADCLLIAFSNGKPIFPAPNASLPAGSEIFYLAPALR